MTKSQLGDRTKQELATLARRRGIKGWEGMKKDELVRALSRPSAKPSKPAAKPPARSAAKARPSRPSAKAAAKPSAKTRPTRPARPSANGTARHVNGAAKLTTNGKAAKPAVAPKLAARPAPKPATPPAPRPEPAIPADKDLSVRAAKGTPVKDRILLTAPDAHWLHAFWELSSQSVQRAEAALGQDWHGARPILRLFDVTSQDTTSTSEAPLRDIAVHGGCNHWYIDVPQPPRSYRADIGYLSRRGTFFVLARSNVIMPPVAGASEVLDEGGSASDRAAEYLDAGMTNRELFDDHFHRPLKENAFGTGATLPGKLKKFFFDIDAELIVYGKTDPSATVTLHNEPVKLRSDGTFTMRFSLPDSRQIIPAIATSTDGLEEQTIVLAIERNTKRLDPMIHDLYGES
jgi:hypothetical protein